MHTYRIPQLHEPYYYVCGCVCVRQTIHYGWALLPGISLQKSLHWSPLLFLHRLNRKGSTIDIKKQTRKHQHQIVIAKNESKICSNPLNDQKGTYLIRAYSVISEEFCEIW